MGKTPEVPIGPCSTTTSAAPGTPGETRLSPWSVGRLRKLWEVPTPGAVTGTPAVVDDRLYVGDWAGNFYKLRARDGSIAWTTKTIAPISASAMVEGNVVVFGDQAGFIYGLDRDTGAVKW
jgi:outer membrane protein assembly factor BamB